MRRGLFLLAALVLASCEDGPEQIFKPNNDDTLQNGHRPKAAYREDGTKDFDFSAGQGDSANRAQFCDAAEQERVVQQLVTKDIVPDGTLGGIPLWTKDGQPVHANDLIGRPEDGKFCDPNVYSNALTWGPTNEIIVFINTETKLVESVAATQQYLGTLRGSFPGAGGNRVEVTLKLREPITLGGRVLDQYTSSADQANRPNAWLNSKNLSDIYRMFRSSFFGATTLDPDFDCVANKICDIIYTSQDETVPQETLVVFQDSGVVLQFSPEGHVTWVEVEPVRVAPFETAAQMAFTGPGGTLKPTFTSASRPDCKLDLSGAMTFAQFKQACVDDSRTLSRATYDVWTQRDAVSVTFKGVTLNFLRRVAKGEVMENGEMPADEDVLFGVNFTRTLNAEVTEFVPAQLAQAYKAKLEARLKALVNDPSHPFHTYSLAIPAQLGTAPQRIGALEIPGPNGQPVSWVAQVTQELRTRYQQLNDAQKAKAGRVLEPVFLVEPFVDAVLERFAGTGIVAADSFKGFRTTDDHRWSIGRYHFFQGGQPYRVEVQYSLNYGAVTSVSLEKGFSQVDELFQGVNTKVRPTGSKYYGIELSTHPQNPLRLGGDGIAVTGTDRRLGTVDVRLLAGTTPTFAAPLELSVPGLSIADRGGYQRQLRGERWEFVPANEVWLYGKDTQIVFHVEADGKIGRVSQPVFKSALPLCGAGTANPLTIAFGDDVRAKVAAWTLTVGPDAFRDCEVVYNYSANGNVLSSVASLTNKVQFSTVDGRAVTATRWR